MATYNEKGNLPSEGDASVGFDPVSDGPNRPFWNDRFVEPKQQHRFTIKIPVYSPNGRKKDSLRMAQAIKNKLTAPPTGDKKAALEAILNRLSNLQLQSNQTDTNTTNNLETATVTDSNGQTVPAQSVSVQSSTGAQITEVRTEFPLTVFNAASREDFNNLLSSRFTIEFDGRLATVDESLGALGITKEQLDNIYGSRTAQPGNLRSQKSIFKSNSFSTADANNLGSNDDIGLYMRVSEYIGYSFTPPGFTYSPGDIGQDAEGGIIRVEGLGTYGRGNATLTFVTTLRDDLHFSLNLLWALSTSAYNKGTRRSSVRLFDPFLTGELADSQKVVTIYEHYARQIKDKDGVPINNINEYAISGVHKLYDPVIESVTFGEFTYGGSELIKVTMNLTYGTPYNQSNFYSYQITEDRYGGGDELNRGDVYAMSEGDYHPQNEYFMKINPADPFGASVKGYLTKQEPNKYSPNTSLRGKTLEELKQRKNQLVFEKNIERLETRRILEGGSKIDKNNLVTKGISEIIAAREDAAEAALDDQRARRRPRRETQDTSDTSFLDEAAREQLEQRQRREQESDRRRQEIDNYIDNQVFSRSGPDERPAQDVNETIRQLEQLKNQ